MTSSTSHRRQYSAVGARDFDVFGNRSLSSNRFEPTFDRPQTSNNRESMRRDVSADAFLSKSQNFNGENAPFANGKRNPRFFHPSFTSNEVFYEHNYGYKNDMPNERLLTPVKNDRFAKQNNDGIRTPNRGDRTPNRGDITPGRAVDRTPERNDYLAPPTPTRNNNNLAPTTPTRNNNFGPFTPTKYERSRIEATEDRFSRPYNEEFTTPKRTAFRDASEHEERQPRERKLSSISQNDQAPLTPVRGRDLTPTQLKKPEETARFFGRGEKAPEADNIRDDRSEASTVISNLSSAGYVCPKCYNRHVSDCKQAKHEIERQQAKNSEKNLAVINRQSLQDEEEKKKQARARRVEETRELGDKLQQAYYEKQNQRRWPAKEQTTTFDGIFNRQEDHKNIQKALGESFRVHLKDQMRYQEAEKEREKKSNAAPYNTSLPIGEGYHNKYLDSPENMRATLKDQVEEKLYNNRRQKEEDRRVAQGKIDEALRSLDDDNEFKKNKERMQRNELREAYEKGLEEKEARKRNHMTQKALEKYHADQGYHNYKAKQQEAEAKFKLQLNAFKQGLAKQVESASYRKIYEDKKNMQGTQTSFGPQKHTKKVYQCGECPGFFEKKYLTKLQ